MRFLRALRGAVKLHKRQRSRVIVWDPSQHPSALSERAQMLVKSWHPSHQPCPPAGILAVCEGPARAQVHPAIAHLFRSRRRFNQPKLQPASAQKKNTTAAWQRLLFVIGGSWGHRAYRLNETGQGLTAPPPPRPPSLHCRCTGVAGGTQGSAQHPLLQLPGGHEHTGCWPRRRQPPGAAPAGEQAGKRGV
jgi:hypothetical protein